MADNCGDSAKQPVTGKDSDVPDVSRLKLRAELDVDCYTLSASESEKGAHHSEINSDKTLVQTADTGESKSVEELSLPVLECNPQLDSNNEDSEDLRLELLPAEIILHICSFLHAKTVIHTLSRVCKSLHVLLSDNTFWKIRIGKRWPNKYPAIPVNDNTFDWKVACIEREEQHRLWQNNGANMESFRFNEGVCAPVDAVHLMEQGRFLAAGSRDHYLNFLDLSKLESGKPESVKNTVVFGKDGAHKGWIWALASIDNILASASWDTCVKLWDIHAGGRELRKIGTKSPLLCMYYDPNLLVAGGFNSQVYHIDPRVGIAVAEKRYQKGPILCMTGDDQYIITASEDKTVAIYDRRAAAVFREIRLNHYAMSMSYGMDQLWIGDYGGNVQLVDATDGDFTAVDTYRVGHIEKVTGIVHTLGALYTCSTDKTIRVLQPTLKPDCIATLPPQKAEVAKIAFQNNVLASACSDTSVGIWVPRPTDG